MEAEIISISDSDEEAVPLPSTSIAALSKNPSLHKQKQPESSTTSGCSSASPTGSTSSNLDLTTQSSFESTSGMALYKPLGADLMASRQSEANRKKRLSIMHPFPAVRDVVSKIRSALGTNNSQINVLALAQQYITALRVYQNTIVDCPNRCRLLARHIIRTMCLIRDLSRDFFESPHYSQKMCELLSLYIHFELQCAADFKDSKIKIAERIIHNIHLHLENAKSSFVLRIFTFLPNMSKENEIATKIFQRLIPEPTIMIKNEFCDRLFVQYLIAFYHWKEAWNDYEDQQKVISFANKFMKPMTTIKTNKMYAKHLPCYIKRDDATGYFLTNMVFFNDLRNASILDGTEDNGPALVDLSEDEKEYPILDLSVYTMEPLYNVKTENGGVVDLTSDSNEPWMNRLIRRAVALEVILPARLATREDQTSTIIELSDSDNENNNKNRNNIESDRDNVDDDNWAFEPGHEDQGLGLVAEAGGLPVDEDSNSMDEIFNELNSSIDFADDSSIDLDVERKNGQRARFEIACNLTDAQARITFDGVVEKELKAQYFQTQSASNAAATTSKEIATTSSAVATTSKSVASKFASDKPVGQRTPAPVSENSTSSKAVVAVEKTVSMETIEIPTQKPTSKKTAEAVEKLNSTKKEAAAAGGSRDTTTMESETIKGLKKTIIANKTKSKEPIIQLFDQEEQTPIVDQPQTSSNIALDPIIQETQAPKEAITLNINETLLSSFDSSDESDEDFLGRFQKPPFKTYLRKAHRKSSKKSTKQVNASSSEEEANTENPSANENNSNTRTTSHSSLPLNEENNENANILFSGKVISLREDESSIGGGGVTPNYLNVPESVEVSKHGSNVVFSMQGRRLSSFPSLKVTNDSSVPDFDDEEDSNSRTDERISRNKVSKKSNISSNMKSQISVQGTDKNTAKSKSVWFAENPQVREIEARTKTSSQQKPSAINTISSTINKISANKQHFSSKISSSPSTMTTSTITKPPLTTKSTINISDSNKKLKSNHLIKSRIPTTESSPATAALKSAQEKDLLQILFPEVFAPPTKPERKPSPSKSSPSRKTVISSGSNSKSNNIKNSPRAINNYQEPAPSTFVTHAPHQGNSRRKSISICSEKPLHSDFDKYLVRKKLLKPQRSTAATAKTIQKTDKNRTKNPRLSKKTRAIIANDPKLGSQLKPVVVLNHIAGPVVILKSGISSETFIEVRPGRFKLKESSPPIVSAAKKIPAIRTKSLSDILSDVVVQEMVEKGKEISQDEIFSGNANVGKQPSPVGNSVSLREKEKEEEDKPEETVQAKTVASVKSQDEVDLKQIKKEEMEVKASSPEATAHVNPSKPVSDCFKKPLKSIAQKRLASASFIHGTTKHAQSLKPAPAIPVRQEAASSESVGHRQEIQEPVTSTNGHLFPTLTSESESDSSCTERTCDLESSEHSDSSQSLISPRRSLKVRLRRQEMLKQPLEYSIVSNSVLDEIKSKDAARKRRARKSAEKKEVLKRTIERADSSTTSSPPKNLDQQPPQSGLINGVLVPSIEAMNTPPPTPPTTVDDKVSVADDTSQEAKSQTTPESSNIAHSHPSAVYENGTSIQNAESNIEALSSNIPPTKTHENGDNPEVNANEVFKSKASPAQRRRFESLNLPPRNQKRSRKKSSTEPGNEISSINNLRSQAKRRRKTICTDVFNPPDISSDEEISEVDKAKDSDVKQMYTFARSLRLSKTLHQNKQDEPSPVRLDENISVPPDLCDSSRLSPTFAALNPTSTTSVPINESASIDMEESQSSDRPNCDSPVITTRNLAVSRTYSKSNMVQQVFVPPEIEMFIEEPNKLVPEQPTTSNLTSNASQNFTPQVRAISSKKSKKPRYGSTSDEDEDDLGQRGKDCQAKSTKNAKQNKKGKKRGTKSRARRLQ